MIKDLNLTKYFYYFVSPTKMKTNLLNLVNLYYKFYVENIFGFKLNVAEVVVSQPISYV